MQMCNMMTYLSPRNNGRTTNEAFQATVFFFGSFFGVDFVVCNFADCLHAQATTVYYTLTLLKKNSISWLGMF